MARLDFPQGTERDEMFRRVARKNRVGRKHNHQARGRAREKARQNLLSGRAIDKARRKKKWLKFQAQVRAYWSGEINGYPETPW